MTGTIKKFDAETASGLITADTGANVPFELSRVMAYDAAGLAANQRVTFDLAPGNALKAANVCVLRTHTDMPPRHGGDGALRLRFMGFEQTGATRAYRFERILAGGKTEIIIVTSDLALFARHHVVLQEGPAVCVRMLNTQIDAGGEKPPLLRCELADSDMVAHLAAQSSRGRKDSPRRPTPA